MEKLIRVFLLAYLLVFPLGQLARLPVNFLGPEVRVYLGDVFLVLAVLVWGIERVRGIEKGKKKVPALTWPVLAFTGTAVVSLVVNLPRLTQNEVLIASFYLLRWITYAGLYFVVRDIKKSILRLRSGFMVSVTEPSKVKSQKSKVTVKSLKLLDLLILVGGLIAILGLLQYLFFPDLRSWLETRGWDPHYYRVYGTFFDPGYFGMIMVLALILVVVRSLHHSNYPSKFILYTLYSILYTSLALTYSRASYLAFLVGMGVIAWKFKKPKFYAAVLVILALTLLLLPRPGGEGVRLEREASIKARIINWKQSLIIAKDHPLFGAGFNAYRYAQRDYGFLDPEDWQESHAGAGADSSLLFVLATTGAVGLTAYLWLIKRAFDSNRSKADLNGYNLAVLASLSALLVHSLFLNSFFYPWIMGWMWTLLGMSEKYLKSRYISH